MSLFSNSRDHWCRILGELFPELEAEVDPLPKNREGAGVGTAQLRASEKGEEPAPKPLTWLERQAVGDMTLDRMLDGLLQACDSGTKIDANALKTS